MPFELHLAGLDTTARVGDSLELELAAITNPVTGAEIHPGAVLPEGLVCNELSFGTSRTFKVSDGIEYDHSGKYTAIAPFNYSSS